jgi:hypothetical protein
LTLTVVQVHPRSIRKAKQQKAAWNAAPGYTKIVKKVSITRSKKPVNFNQEVKQWIIDNTRPSSNSKNVIKWKGPNKQKEEHIVQWRDESIQKQFETCKLSIGHGDLLHKTYFYQCIPKYIKKTKPKEGLCPYHMNANKIHREVARLRKRWHFISGNPCPCKCDFCSPTGCNHGKNPLGKDNKCHQMTCERCKDLKCLVEWSSDKKTVWYTQSLEKRPGGGMHWVDESHCGTRKAFMQYVHRELTEFWKHDTTVSWVKEQVLHLKTHLPLHHILIKADFIQNMVHQRGAESSTGYYNKRQTQLLVFVVWFHSADSTEQKPDIKMEYIDYLSGFLKHTSLFFQKCFVHLIEHLNTYLPTEFFQVCACCACCLWCMFY